MRSEGSIRHQLKQVKYRHLQRLLKVAFKQDPLVCPECDHEFRSKDKAAVKKEFNAFFRENPIGKIAEMYPDAAALLWVLGEEAAREDLETPETPEAGVGESVNPEALLAKQALEDYSVASNCDPSPAGGVPEMKPWPRKFLSFFGFKPTTSPKSIGEVGDV